MILETIQVFRSLMKVIINSEFSGSTTSFANSIYYPGLYKGFKARVSKSVASLSTGANSMQLVHSTQGSTNVVKFVKDNLTASPTISATGSLTQGTAGTFDISLAFLTTILVHQH